MTTVPIRTAKAKLSEYVDMAVTTHEHVTITRNGRPAAVIISAEEWESLQETLFWMSHHARDDVAAGLAEHDAGETLSEAQVRQMFGASTKR